MGGGFGGRAWSLLLAAAGFFYGLVGVLWLGVRIDVLLAAGSLALATAAAQGYPSVDSAARSSP